MQQSGRYKSVALIGKVGLIPPRGFFHGFIFLHVINQIAVVLEGGRSGRNQFNTDFVFMNNSFTGRGKVGKHKLVMAHKTI